MNLRKMLPAELAKTVPGLYTTEDTPAEDKIAVLKFFTPTGGWTWFATEGAAVLGDGTEVHLGSIELPAALPPPSVSAQDGEVEDVRFFGYVQSGLGEDCNEWGYFSLRELMALRLPFGLGVERDLYWKPQPVPGAS